MTFNIFEIYSNKDFFIIDTNSKKESSEVQRKLFEWGYTWPSTGNFTIDKPNLYVCGFPYKKDIAYLHKDYLDEENLKKEIDKSIFYVTGEDFLESPKKYMNNI